MPLPRFERLPAQTRARILAVARAHFARDGFEAASYNKIISDAGMSKTTAYHYFDGKADLYAAVLADVEARVASVVGEWHPAPDPETFWSAVAATSRALLAHLADHPEDRAVLAASPAVDAGPWVGALVADAVRLGLVTPDEHELMAELTGAVLGALDRHALARPDRAAQVAAQMPQLLARLWGSGT
jgi:AcrR family transcriptional regulator